MNSFNDFGLAEPIIRALAQEQYTTPTPIQTDAIPLVLSGRDLVGIAQTGTGKTAAFALPILNRLAANRKPLELSGQILESFRTYGRHMRIQSALVIGGVPMGRQVRDLMNGLDVLVATPGRLLDLMKSNGVRLNQVEVLVLDEADRMLDMGFIHDIRTIVAKLPKERQTLLFSATMPREIADLASHMLRDPARVAVTPVASTQERVEQRVIMTDKSAKSALLIEVLRDEVTGQTLVFTRTKHGADKVVKSLHHAGLSAEAIHGNKSQNQRERVLGAFRAGKLKTLVATDIAARGIDVDGISHVINYDLPNIPESYVHRIGRTARAGADGIAISFCEAEERPFLRDIEKLIRMSIPAGEHASDRRSPAPPREHHANGSRPVQQQRKQQYNGQHRARTERKPDANRHRRPAEAPAAAHGGEIGAVAFMQPKRGGQRHRAAHAGQRAPR